MTPILPTITEAGLAAVFNQSSTGFAAEITEIAVGDRGYTPSQTQEALHHEMARFPIADGVMTTPTQAHLTALDDTEREYWVREVGFYLGDGTLFAVYSHPTNPLAYKTAGVDFLHAYDLLLTAVPVGSVIVRSTGARLNLYLAEQLAQLAAVQVEAMVRELKMQFRLNDMDEANEVLTQRVGALESRLAQIEYMLGLQAKSQLDQTASLAQVAAVTITNGNMWVSPLLAKR